MSCSTLNPVSLLPINHLKFVHFVRISIFIAESILLYEYATVCLFIHRLKAFTVFW